MPFCHSCGGSLPEEANFCPACGKPISVDEPAKPDMDWENCMIVAEMVGEKWSPLFPGDYIQFRARGGGCSGDFWAGESPRVKAGLGDYYEPNRKNKQHVKALEGLVEVLKRDGWEQTGKGERWYNLKFQRRRPQQ